MLLSISQLAELTGRDRRTLAKKLEPLPMTEGEKGGHTYESVDALARIYGSDSLEAARAEQARSQAELNRLRQQDLQRKRIPIEVVLSSHDQTLQAMASTLKAAGVYRRANQSNLLRLSSDPGQAALVESPSIRTVDTVAGVQNGRAHKVGAFSLVECNLTSSDAACSSVIPFSSIRRQYLS
jgi:antitoxin component of RelBE/YafQ-DinJ toxin-antitoxin module